MEANSKKNPHLYRTIKLFWRASVNMQVQQKDERGLLSLDLAMSSLHITQGWERERVENGRPCHFRHSSQKSGNEAPKRASLLRSKSNSHAFNSLIFITRKRKGTERDFSSAIRSQLYHQKEKWPHPCLVRTFPVRRAFKKGGKSLKGLFSGQTPLFAAVLVPVLVVTS